MTDISLWAPLLLTLGSMIALFEILGSHSAKARFTASLICVVLTLRYIHWRILCTLPHHQSLLQSAWANLFLLVELATLTSSMLVYFFMSRTINRSSEADAHQNSAAHQLPVDVFIATYNESRDILERTAVGALAIDHADLRVWILDDGNRAWVRDLASSLGVQYVSRVKGKHAKAGNVNNGVQKALASDRPPAFFLLLDADFVPHREILKRTLGLFHDESVGIVQTPQHFFNPDPVQSNLLCSSVWPDEQRFFFNSLLPSKDAWGAAFCCGTSAVFRVKAFVAANGMATETVTEDMLTTFKFEEFGYRTIFLNERLSLGLAPESLVDFISQRARWCLGAIQQIFTRWSSFGRGRVSLINRVAFFDTVLYWISGAAFKLMIVAAPLLYWLTGTSAMHASAAQLLRELAPMVVANLLFMSYLAGNRVFPVMTDITQLLTAFVICRTVVTGLLRPFGRPFKVTAKGLSTSGVTVQWRLLWPFLAMAALTAFGVLVHVPDFSRAHGTQGYTANIFWSLLNGAVLILAALACIELPHRRRDERFSTEERAIVRLSSCFSDQAEDEPVETSLAKQLHCRVKDISLGGACLVAPEGWHDLAGPAQLLLDGCGEDTAIALPFNVVNRKGSLLTIQFHSATWIRHALIRKLFTGAYHREIENIKVRHVMTSLVRVLVS